MKKLLTILLSLQSVMISCSSIVSCGFLKVKKTNEVPSSPIEQEKILSEIEATWDEPDKVLPIYIKEFDNKQQLVDAIKNLPKYKEIITDKQIELLGDFDFFNEKNNTVIESDRDVKAASWISSFIIAHGNFKLGTQQRELKFRIALTMDFTRHDLKTARRSIETLESSNINLLVLQNKSELIKALEMVIKEKTKKITRRIIKSNLLTIYNKNDNIEITDANQNLIKDGFEVKVTVEIGIDNETLSAEFNCKIADQNKLDLKILETVKNRVENLSQPIEVKIGETFDTDLLNNFILKRIKSDINKNIELSNKLEFFDDINNIKFDTPFVVKTDLKLNSQNLPANLKVKLIHSTDLDLLATSIQNLQNDKLEAYMEDKSMELLGPYTKSKFLKVLFENNKFKENIELIDIIHNLGFDKDHYLENTKIINKTSDEELKQVTWGQTVTLNGTFKIWDGELPFEFDIELVDYKETLGIQILSNSVIKDIQEGAINYIESKHYPTLSKKFIIEMLEDIMEEKHWDHKKRYEEEIEFSDLELYRYSKKYGEYFVVKNDNEIKYNEEFLLKGSIKIKNKPSIYGIFIGKIKLINPNKWSERNYY